MANREYLPVAQWAGLLAAEALPQPDFWGAGELAPALHGFALAVAAQMRERASRVAEEAGRADVALRIKALEP
jgi:hypothetical protein